MDSEPDPPRRPRRSTADFVLVFFALTCMTTLLVGPFVLLATGLDSRVAPDRVQQLAGGLVAAAFAFLGVSIVLRWRRQ